MLPLLVRTRFQILFTPLSEVLFAFPSRYWFTIGHSVVFSLRGWSPYLQTEFHVFRPTRLSSTPQLRLRDYHSLSFTFPDNSAIIMLTFGLFPFRSPLLRKSRLISFPRGTEMFHFSRFALDCSNNTCVLGFPIRIYMTIALLTSSSRLFAG